jgi:hypothetical protein
MKMVAGPHLVETSPFGGYPELQEPRGRELLVAENEADVGCHAVSPPEI